MVPHEDEIKMLQISWPAVAAIIASMGFLLSLSTIVIRMFVKSIILEMGNNIQKVVDDRVSQLYTDIEKRFSSKDSVDGELKLINNKLGHVEQNIADIKNRQWLADVKAAGHTTPPQ